MKISRTNKNGGMAMIGLLLLLRCYGPYVQLSIYLTPSIETSWYARDLQASNLNLTELETTKNLSSELEGNVKPLQDSNLNISLLAHLQETMLNRISEVKDRQDKLNDPHESSKALEVDTNGDNNSTTSSLPDYGCLWQFQQHLNKEQVQWRKEKVPMLTSLVPLNETLNLVFTIKHLNQDYIKWTRAHWTCRRNNSTNATSINATLHGKAKERHVLILECPRDTDTLDATVMGTNLNHSYTIPSEDQFCPWSMQPAYLSACNMIARYDVPKVAEWVAYHTWLGVEQFYIYLNDDERALDSLSGHPQRSLFRPTGSPKRLRCSCSKYKSLDGDARH